MRLHCGQIVEVEILDHVEGGNAPLCFTIYGKIINVSRQSITVASWSYTNEPSKTTDPNVKPWVLVRTAIKKIHHLQRTA